MGDVTSGFNIGENLALDPKFNGMLGFTEPEMRTLLDLYREHVAAAMSEQTGIRDYLDGEKVVQAFLAAHFSMVGQFVTHTERDLNKGYTDLYLGPFVAQYPDIGYAYVIEVKYLKRSERVDASVVAETLRGRGSSLRVIWRTRGCGVSRRRCGTSGWWRCSTGGSWRGARRWSREGTTAVLPIEGHGPTPEPFAVTEFRPRIPLPGSDGVYIGSPRPCSGRPNGAGAARLIDPRNYDWPRTRKTWRLQVSPPHAASLA